jgi:DNA-binding transcriptional ArsR family regulator
MAMKRSSSRPAGIRLPAPRPPAAARALTGPQIEAVSSLFSVLAEPTRLRILAALEGGPRTVGELVDSLGLKQANASKQLGILHAAGVLGRAKEGTAVRYFIRMPLVFKLCDLVCGELRAELESRARGLRA